VNGFKVTAKKAGCADTTKVIQAYLNKSGLEQLITQTLSSSKSDFISKGGEYLENAEVIVGGNSLSCFVYLNAKNYSLTKKHSRVAICFTDSQDPTLDSKFDQVRLVTKESLGAEAVPVFYIPWNARAGKYLNNYFIGKTIPDFLNENSTRGHYPSEPQTILKNIFMAKENDDLFLLEIPTSIN
jgi:hypothetical protein